MMRDDLKLTAYALYLDYTIAGHYGSPLHQHDFNAAGVPDDSLTFNRGSIHVWSTANGWRVAQRGVDNRYPKPQPTDFHKHLKDALDRGAML